MLAAHFLNLIDLRLKETVAIQVSVGEGEHKTTWHLPKDLLAHYSTFFATALKGDFAEASTNAISLPEVEPRVFEVFVQWLYLGIFHREKASRHSVSRHSQLAEAWILGDRLGCAAFQDFAMLKLTSYHKRYVINQSFVTLAYRNSPSGSKLRRCLVAHYLYDRFHKPAPRCEEWTPDGDEEEIVDFLVDVGRVAVAKGREGFENPYEKPYQFLEVITEDMILQAFAEGLAKTVAGKA